MEPARVVTEAVDGLHHEYRVELDPGSVREAVDARLQRAARDLSVPGFRPGRAPLSVLRIHHGKRLHDAIVDQMAIEVSRQLIAERALLPRGRPSIHIDGQAPESFLLTLEVTPEIEPRDLSAIQLQRLSVEDPDSESAALAREHLRLQLFDALVAQYDFPVPAAMVDSEHARICAGYLEAVGEKADRETEHELRAIAERRIRLALLFSELARRYGITVTRAEVEELVEAQAERDPEHQEQIIDYYLDHPTALAELQSPLLEERVVEHLLERCSIRDETVDARELRQRAMGSDTDSP